MKKKKVKKRPPIREVISEKLSLPNDMLLDLPRLTLCGNHELEVENYKNVLEYLDHAISLNCTEGIIRLSGEHLEITAITDDSVSIRGNILSISFSL